MPIYEYVCRQCEGRLSVWWRPVAQMERSKPLCPRCQSADLQRLVSKTAFVRSGEGRLDSLGDADLEGLGDEDPRALGRLMRQLGDETGEDMGEEFDEIVGRLEAGEDPESIESSLPGGGGATDGYVSGDSFDPGA